MTTNHILQHRRERAGRKIIEAAAVERRFPWIRLGVVLVAVVSAYAAFQLLPDVLAWGILALGVLAFGWTANRHEAVIERIRQMEMFQRMLNAQSARAALDWRNIPAAASIPVSPEHPFASDLEITGSGSLHQCIDTTTASGGSQRLAGWLLQLKPDPSAAQYRQKQVQELLARPVFRAQSELFGLLALPEGARHSDTTSLVRWLETHAERPGMRSMIIALFALSAINITLFLLNANGLLPPLWVVSLAIYLGIQSLRFREISETFEESYSLARQLGGLRRILVELEGTPRKPGSELNELLSAFHSEPTPSNALRRVGRIVSAASLRNNPFLSLLLNLLVPWDVYLTYQFDRLKEDLRGVLPQWLDAWHTLEALVALANFAALHPETRFPIFLPPDAQPVFVAKRIGHPLIPVGHRVNNNFSIAELGKVGVITGSNMSGKSTFLRTLGINIALMNAGGPVAAERLESIPFRLYTSMTLTDSLSDGISFFYAEVRRLKALLDALRAPQDHPLFFLIDEIFRGTNNRERQIGSQSYTRALTGQHGTGLISTHDLELAHLAEAMPQVQNYHFREDIQGEKMVFDYTLREGPSPTTNALRIMSLAGLPVPRETG